MLLEKKYESAVDDALKSKKYLNQQEIDNILNEEFNALIKHISCIKPTKENVEFIKWFFEKLRQEKIEIRIYPRETLHAKLYLLNYKDTRHGQGMAFVGSSNISMSGFNLNTELNVAVYGDENHKYLSEWFNKRWKESERTDFTALAQKALKKSWVMNDEVTPFRIYLRVLDEIFSSEEEREIPETKYGEVELWDFQRDAVIDAYHRLNEYNGVFLADVPGMGKTYMGAALLAHLQEDGKRAMVICPPKLVEQWKDVLSEFGVGTARVFSIGKLDEIINSEKLLMRDIVLIDESHHLRNPETNRYRDMEIICEGKKVILVGATPQNLNIWDLYYQMKLFTPSEVNHKFRIDPPSLKGLVLS
jgi:SNF2 family DNA or RNA helicase